MSWKRKLPFKAKHYIETIYFGNSEKFSNIWYNSVTESDNFYKPGGKKEIKHS